MTITVDVQISSAAGIAPEKEQPLCEHLVACAQHATCHPTVVNHRASRLNGESQRPTGDITVRLVGKDESADLNFSYRQKNQPTNVLSFPYVADDFAVHENALATHTAPVGDLVICSPVVVDEAEQQNKTVDAHYAHMVIHGVLHLLGFDHVEDREAEEMESLEAHLLLELGVGNPYQPTVS